MKKLIVLSFAALTMLSCNNKEQKTEPTNAGLQEVGEPIAALDLGCYVFKDGKNTVSMEIIENGKEIKGNLTYTLAEKDKNSGSFTGELQKGLLIANYTFQSEGKESIRQVAFKVDGDKLIEGYGELNNDGTAFKDVSKLQFTSKTPLTKTDCNNLKESCLFEKR